MSRHTHVLPTVGCAALAVLGISACGSSSPSGSSGSSYAKQPASKILSEATSAVKAAKSFSFHALIADAGHQTNADVGISGAHDLSVEVMEGSYLIKVALVSGAPYFYANTAYWKAKGGSSLSSSEIAALANRWFHAPASVTSGLTSSFKAVTSSGLATCLAASFPKATVTGTTTISGQSAVVLHTDGGKPGTGKADLDVATAAPHNVLRYTVLEPAQAGTAPGCSGSPTQKGTGSPTFSKWNTTTVTAPANAAQLP